MSQVMTARQGVDQIEDGAVLFFDGCAGSNFCESFTEALEQRFLATGQPRDLTLIFVAGHGDGKEQGLNRLGHEGLLKRVIGGHWSLLPKVGQLVVENKVAGYNFPSGVLTQWIRDMVSRKPTLTQVGLHTYIDPRHGGGKLNAMTQENLVSIETIGGQEYLHYHAIRPDFVFIRGTYADSCGNIVFDKEGLVLSATSLAQLGKTSGGKVLVQVEAVKEETFDPKQVKIPGLFVDAVVIAEKPEHHWLTYAKEYDPALAGQGLAALPKVAPLPQGMKKVIGRRAARELQPGQQVVVGIGASEAAVQVAAEEGYLDKLCLIVDSGTIGGLPASGSEFGLALNPEAILDVDRMFDFIDGGGLDVALLGMAQVGPKGDVNVSKFGKLVAGCGGFVNITQATPKVIFCGTFTSGGLKTRFDQGHLVIEQEGKVRKFVSETEQITFNGTYARQKGTETLYVTERAVFRLTDQGLMLCEIAPGIDLKRHILDQMDFAPLISDNLREMDGQYFLP